MNERYIQALYYLYKGKIRSKIARKIGQEKFGNSKRRYMGRRMLSADEMNTFIYNSLISGEPFMVCRFGSTELTSLSSFYFKNEGDYQKAIDHVCFYSGFFPNDVKLGPKFMDIMLDSCAQTDVLAVWFVQYEDYFIKNVLSRDAKIGYLMNIEPWKSVTPWTRALKGKKVLVIHPFDKSIQQQYKMRDKIFADRDLLPEFELKTLKAVQTLAGEKDRRFNTWFDALDYMYNEAMKIDFDIAIIGCGAYGMPLAAMLKKAGKQAIHLGGITQILFGIKGKRWEEEKAYTYVKDLMNENWVYPAESERPKASQKVEGNCYWG